MEAAADPAFYRVEVINPWFARVVAGLSLASLVVLATDSHAEPSLANDCKCGTYYLREYLLVWVFVGAVTCLLTADRALIMSEQTLVTWSNLVMQTLLGVGGAAVVYADRCAKVNGPLVISWCTLACACVSLGTATGCVGSVLLFHSMHRPRTAATPPVAASPLARWRETGSTADDADTAAACRPLITP
jgi:hypothetical protein